MPHVVVRPPGEMAFSIPLPEAMRVGRQDHNDLVLDGEHVSREHAVISRAGGRWEVRDLASRHGTRVNGELVEIRALVGGDRIQVGDVLLEFHEEDERTIVHHQVTAAGPPARVAEPDRRLKLLFDVSRAIGAIGDTQAMLGEMLEAIVDVLGGDRALVGLGDAERGIARRFAHARAGAPPEAVVSRAVLDATQ